MDVFKRDWSKVRRRDTNTLRVLAVCLGSLSDNRGRLLAFAQSDRFCLLSFGLHLVSIDVTHKEDWLKCPLSHLVGNQVTYLWRHALLSIQWEDILNAIGASVGWLGSVCRILRAGRIYSGWFKGFTHFAHLMWLSTVRLQETVV